LYDLSRHRFTRSKTDNQQTFAKAETFSNFTQPYFSDLQHFITFLR